MNGSLPPAAKSFERVSPWVGYYTTGLDGCRGGDTAWAGVIGRWSKLL